MPRNGVSRRGQDGAGTSHQAVPQVGPSIHAMRARLERVEARGLAPDEHAALRGVRMCLDEAEEAATAHRRGLPRLAAWWRGTYVERAYRHLHAAQVQLVDALDELDIDAAIPGAVAKVQAALPPGDPRRLGAAAFEGRLLDGRRAILRQLLEDGYDASDHQHLRLRSFRNVVLLSAMFVLLLVAGSVWFVSVSPGSMPLCFPQDGTDGLNCPSGNDVSGPRALDVVVVAVAGLLGAALSLVLNIQTLQGTSNPYDVPVALGVLKLPLGALTAIVGLLLVHGEFVPGLSVLDSQGQIIAYAVLFGAGQHVFSRLLDRRAQSMLDALPSKDIASDPGTPIRDEQGRLGPRTGTPTSRPTEAAAVSEATGEEEVDDLVDPALADAVGLDDEPDPAAPEPPFLTNPLGDEAEQVQDDESPVMPPALRRDHR